MLPIPLAFSLTGVVQDGIAWLWTWLGPWAIKLLQGAFDLLPDFVTKMPWDQGFIYAKFLNKFFPMVEALELFVAYFAFYALFFVVKLVVRLF